VTGDAAFMMHGAEISTAAQERVGAIWVVLSDNDLAMVSQGMQGLFPSAGWLRYYEIGKPDLVKFAEGLGAFAVDVRTPEDFRAALGAAVDRSRSGQPQAIILHIDTNPSPPYEWPELKK
jgi:acetolactate synthase-1/2/3 large subunit